MPQLSPTTLAVADAHQHYRPLHSLTFDELAEILAENGHGLTTENIGRIESAERAAAVDDLVALAAALDATPAVFVSHIAVDMPVGEAPLVTGLSADVVSCELRAWGEGSTALDHRSRLRYVIDRRDRQAIRAMHIAGRLLGAHEGLQGPGDCALQEVDVPLGDGRREPDRGGRARPHAG